jgi:hypothetical protein
MLPQILVSVERCRFTALSLLGKTDLNFRVD